jgi:hypothetical protein
MTDPAASPTSDPEPDGGPVADRGGDDVYDEYDELGGES